ncbi:HNH endonuclease signature motif containing protein (plasmid) [Bacillus carboniphilus]|uniref:Putative HNH nuclease YajD n=1 Tax=Bacillus carboniphilus TaxID=86663 RepID=A0ABY9K055_9BACI|nr:HNH endonuclease [Bacillus carboniphilus]WLR44399.1 HNH endonuclease signature motif containing protein [Bacillus carboniphilus]
MPNQSYYDKHHRDQDAKRFYNSKAWEICRENVLKRDHYLCQHCLQDKIITPADMVHHIVHYRDDPSKGLDESNLISLCNTCHGKEHPEKGNKNTQKRSKTRVKMVKAKSNREWT